MSEARDESKYRTGHDDGLSPLAPHDLAAIDSVDDQFYPMTGTDLQAHAMASTEGLGSDREFQSYLVNYAGFHGKSMLMTVLAACKFSPVLPALLIMIALHSESF